jgi:predicted ATPase
MRIAFTGASGTGKTTLAKYIAEKHGLEVNPVGSRSVAQAMGFASPYDVDAAGKRKEFQRELLASKLIWETERESFVTDRTPLDNLAYTVMHGVDVIDDQMLAAAIAGLHRYTHVVFCPIDSHCHTGDDAARVHDLTYHRIFECVISGLYTFANQHATFAPVFPTRTLFLPGLADRKATIDAMLSDLPQGYLTKE